MGLCHLNRNLIIASMDNTIQSFSYKGKKNFSIQMPQNIVAIAKMESSRADTKDNFLVALKNGDIRTQCGKTLIDTLKTDDLCNAILFGVFGREEGCLVVNTKSGGIITKIVGRQAKLN